MLWADTTTPSPEDQFIRETLVKQGETKGLDKSPQLAEAMEAFRKNMLAQLALDAAQEEGMPDFTARAEEIYQVGKDTKYHLPLRLRVRALAIIAPKSQEEAVRKQLQDIRDQITQNKIDFKEAVLKYSTAPDIKLTEGDSQWFQKGQKADDFYETALKLSPDQPLSEVFFTQSTGYLLQYLDKKEPETRPFEDAKSEIISKLQNDYKEEQKKIVLDKIKADYQKTLPTQANAITKTP